MDVKEFDYNLPAELIADRPLPHRSHSRLMVINRQSGTIEHHQFKSLPQFLNTGDLLVFNDSRVFPARLHGTKTPGGAAIEILLLKQRTELVWEALAQRAIRLSMGTVVTFPDGSRCSVVEVLGQGRFVFEFQPVREWQQFLAEIGEIPLPPYIHQARRQLIPSEQQKLEQLDRERYQTVYARKQGSAAAPTAGLHFDEQVLETLEARGIQSAWVTLHVGLDTFQPVMVETVAEHQIHSEWCDCSSDTADLVQQTRQSGNRVVAVGTTACRTLESHARENWPGQPHQTRLFLYPGEAFLAVNTLLTNFHLPRSSLLMLVAAFMGLELQREAYRQAITERYRFYSYGDAMLIL